ncbi:putative zinc-binding metallopeptidase [Verrucomicrobia bacterium]|nr:putative zinc-binding metallopeptidase [Verrucomicrobiota bacterium]MDC0218577.1 putative zinc-binding metallopeptidase [Verrucomicrobiota bacterium]
MKTKIHLTALVLLAFVIVLPAALPTPKEQINGVPVFLHGLNPPASWKVRCDAPVRADKKQLDLYRKILAAELGKYPMPLLQKSKLKGIAIVKNLSVAGQRRAAMPDYENEILYLDFQRGAHNPAYQAHVIHHEFFHLLEQELNGSAYFKDPEWAKLNPKNFRYGKGGKKQRGNDNFALVHPQSGFINRYSTSALEEDKAEIYAALFIPGERKKINAMAAKDTHLAAKIKMMRRILHAIDPAIPAPPKTP